MQAELYLRSTGSGPVGLSGKRDALGLPVLISGLSALQGRIRDGLV
jgi:hypothetical protein